MRGGQRTPVAPSPENWGLVRVGWRGCCGRRGPCFLEQKQPPPHSPAQAGPGTWAGAIPRPKNNGRELGRGRGEAAPQRLPDWGSEVTPGGKMWGTEAAGAGTVKYKGPREPAYKTGEARPGRKTDPFPDLCPRGCS